MVMWGSHSWLQPAFQPARGHLHNSATAGRKAGCSLKRLPHKHRLTVHVPAGYKICMRTDSCAARLRVVLWLILLSLPLGAQAPLPGTAPLNTQGDLAAQMVDGIN